VRNFILNEKMGDSEAEYLGRGGWMVCVVCAFEEDWAGVRFLSDGDRVKEVNALILF
jgi:hypothetical protein